jgi:hypothetical protein
MTAPLLANTIRFHLVISLAGAVLIYFLGGEQHALSFLIGAGMMGLNWWLLIQTWARILGKKSIALAIGIIVIKWTLFGTICILLARTAWIMPTWLMLGIASVLLSALLAALESKRR